MVASYSRDLANYLLTLKEKKIAVVGDFLIDQYTFGTTSRISPEAPVPVLLVKNEETKPGGAGNVVFNLLALGAKVLPIGRIGNDAGGTILKNLMNAHLCENDGLFVQKNYTTPMKNRIIASNQQMLRIDHELVTPLPEELEEHIISQLSLLFKEIDLIAISDYGKGFLTPTLLQKIIDYARQKQIPVIADPKGTDFKKYAGVNIIKPNLGEAYQAAGLVSTMPIEMAAAKILQTTEAEVVMITRSSDGISLFYPSDKREDFPIPEYDKKDVKDVTGAGDTVLAMLSLGIANHLPLNIIVQLCNMSASISVEHVGCAHVSRTDLLQRLCHVEKNKIYYENSFTILKELLSHQPHTIIQLEDEEIMSSNLLKMIKEKHHPKKSIVVQLSKQSQSYEFIDLLAALQEVSFIAVTDASPFQFSVV